MFEKIGKWMNRVGMGHAVLAFGVPALVILLLALFAGCAGAQEANTENQPEGCVATVRGLPAELKLSPESKRRMVETCYGMGVENFRREAATPAWVRRTLARLISKESGHLRGPIRFETSGSCGVWETESRVEIERVSDGRVRVRMNIQTECEASEGQLLIVENDNGERIIGGGFIEGKDHEIAFAGFLLNEPELRETTFILEVRRRLYR